MNYAEWRKLGIVTAYTLQRLPVVERLKDGEVHRQPHEKTAAFEPTISASERNAHRRAYSWMAAQYRVRIGHRQRAALSWVWFEVIDLESLRRHDDEYLIHLSVPKEELLASIHSQWQHVLWNDQIHDPSAIRLPVLIEQTRSSNRASWERMFEIPDDLDIGALQAVLDRIEPGWVTRMESLQPNERQRVLDASIRP